MKEMKEMATRFVFLGGTGRSGTTLMHKILCSSGCVAGSAEFDHLKPLMERRSWMHRADKLERQAPYYDAESLDVLWRDFITSLLRRPLLSKPGATVLAEKTPSNIAVISELLALFPDSRFIAMVRDGRDVVASHLDIRSSMVKSDPSINGRWLKEFEPRAVGCTWKRNLQDIESVKGRPESARLKIVRYEDLVSSPESTVKEVCTFLDIPFEHGMLYPERFNARDSGHAINIDGIWYDEQRFSQPINASSVGRWRSRLTLPQKWLCAIQLGDALIAQRYALDATSLWLSRIARFVRKSLRRR